MYQNCPSGTGNKDQHVRNPSSFILSHTQIYEPKAFTCRDAPDSFRPLKQPGLETPNTSVVSNEGSLSSIESPRASGYGLWNPKNGPLPFRSLFQGSATTSRREDAEAANPERLAGTKKPCGELIGGTGPPTKTKNVLVLVCAFGFP